MALTWRYVSRRVSPRLALTAIKRGVRLGEDGPTCPKVRQKRVVRYKVIASFAEQRAADIANSLDLLWVVLAHRHLVVHQQAPRLLLHRHS